MIKELAVYHSNRLSTFRITITSILLCCGFVNFSFADPDTSEASATVPTADVSAQEVSTTTAQAKTEVQAKPKAEPKAMTPQDLAKEQRLEDLRYKHLWIAYSIVWLVIFMFIRNTWKRSEAVAERLDELKTRIKRLEERNHEEG